MQAILVNWKTTLTGVLTLVTVAADAALLMIDNDPATNPNWSVVIPAIVAAIGLIFARDANKSSQDSGVRP